MFLINYNCINIFMVGFHGNMICEMKEKSYATSCYMVAMDNFYSLEFFFIILVKFAKKSMVND